MGYRKWPEKEGLVSRPVVLSGGSLSGHACGLGEGSVLSRREPGRGRGKNEEKNAHAC